LFRERGFEGVSIPEITKAAGLTHGGFYKSFGSKNALAAEACEKSFDHANNWLASTKSSDNGLAEYFKNYLSVRHRDDSRGGCPMAALATDIHRQCDDVQKAFSLGVDSYLTNLEDSLSSASGKSRPAQEGSMAALTMIVGRWPSQERPSAAISRYPIRYCAKPGLTWKNWTAASNASSGYVVCGNAASVRWPLTLVQDT
jgi:TetR/AcrR family transcriptional repressor of nem operon